MSDPFDFDRIIDRRAIANLNQWKWYPADVLPRWLADMDFLCPQPILAGLRGALDHGILGYELASPSLLELVAGRMQRLYGWTVAPEMVVPIPSVNAGCRMAATVTCQPGEGVLVQPPVFYHFLDFAEAYGLARQDAPLRRVQQGRIIDYELDEQAFRRALHGGGVKTGMFLLCNPHNPVGRVFTAAELEWMAGICAEHDVVICSDDIHSELTLGDAAYIPLAAQAPQVAERTITLLGPGKAFNISGLGCAFAIIPDAALRERFCRELERLALDVNSMGLAAARAAYSGECDAWLAALRSYLAANRDHLVAFFAQETPHLHMTMPEATYMAWLDCNQYVRVGTIVGSPAEFFLRQAKVALYDGAAFGPGGEGFVRLNFACPRSVLDDALRRIARALA